MYPPAIILPFYVVLPTCLWFGFASMYPFQLFHFGLLYMFLLGWVTIRLFFEMDGLTLIYIYIYRVHPLFKLCLFIHFRTPGTRYKGANNTFSRTTRHAYSNSERTSKGYYYGMPYVHLPKWEINRHIYISYQHGNIYTTGIHSGSSELIVCSIINQLQRAQASQQLHSQLLW